MFLISTISISVCVCSTIYIYTFVQPERKDQKVWKKREERKKSVLPFLVELNPFRKLHTHTTMAGLVFLLQKTFSQFVLSFVCFLSVFVSHP